jgi:hypothetical protein
LLNAADSFDEFLQYHPKFQSREPHAETRVYSTLAKGQVGVRIAVDINLEGVRKHGLVTIGRDKP